MEAIQLSLDDAGVRGHLELPRFARPRSFGPSRRGTAVVGIERERTAAAAAFAGELLSAKAAGPIRFVVACCKTKRDVPSPAAQLYASPLFLRSARLAERLGAPLSILSAKHGLIPAERTIEPYDQSLKTCSIAERIAWTTKVGESFRADIDPAERLILLAGSTYSSHLLPILEAEGRSVVRPLTGMALGERLAFLNRTHRVLDRYDAARCFYGHMAEIADRTGMKTLPELLEGPLPARGVYFFFDPEEPSALHQTLPRLVRVGTHGVSSGSKASLRTRLRAHLGTSAGLGNHRSSVFRLHVGEALLKRGGVSDRFPSWGKGQSAGPEVTQTERELEREVSRYVSALRVLFVEVDDEPGKQSMRAVIERQVIALFTEYGATLEPASEQWLGAYSSQASVRESGLWNVRAVGDRVDLALAAAFGGRATAAANSVRVEVKG